MAKALQLTAIAQERASTRLIRMKNETRHRVLLQSTSRRRRQSNAGHGMRKHRRQTFSRSSQVC